MPVSVGDVVIGKVTGITKFGAFVSLPEGQSGLVHISEVADSYVERIEDHLKKYDQVTVKVLTITDQGKISLSLKQAKPKTKKPVEIEWKVDEGVKELSFEDKLSKFLKDSNEKYSQMRARENKKSAGQKARGKN